MREETERFQLWCNGLCGVVLVERCQTFFLMYGFEFFMSASTSLFKARAI